MTAFEYYVLDRCSSVSINIFGRPMIESSLLWPFMHFHKIWTWHWQDWHSSVFSVQVHITFPSRSTLKKLPDDNKSDCYVTSWRTIWLSQITFERCGVRRGGGRHVPGGNLKKPLTMMGLATVAVTTLRTLARLHTVHCTLCTGHHRTGDYAGMMHFNPQGGQGHSYWVALMKFIFI